MRSSSSFLSHGPARQRVAAGCAEIGADDRAVDRELVGHRGVDAPAAALRRIAPGAARADRGPVHGQRLDVQADALHGLQGHQRQGVQVGDVAGHQQHHLLALVARLGQHLPGLGDVGRAIGFGAGGCFVGAAADEVGGAVTHPHVQRITHRRVEPLLAHRLQQGLAHLRVVEGRMQVIHDQLRLLGAGRQQLDIRVASQWRDVVGGHLLDEIDLALLQAATALLESGRYSHSTRSKWLFLLPASPLGGSLRAT